MVQFALQELLVLWSTPIYVFIITLEIIFSRLQHRNWYSLKDTLHNVYLMLLNISFDLMLRGVYVFVLALAFKHRIYAIDQPVIYWVLLVIGIDFLFYWLHRLEHSVRLFWAVHVTHHSSPNFNFTVGFRSSVLQPLYRFIFFLPLAFLGFRAGDIALVFSACQIWGILVHTEWVGKLGLLEKFFVTPSHHRVHHACNPLYLDKNMGMFLIIWDKFFGTFQEEKPASEYQPIRYGLTSEKALTLPVGIVLHEWKDMVKDLSQPLPYKIKLRYLLGPPGWSHDGSRFTSAELRRLEKEMHQNPDA